MKTVIIVALAAAVSSTGCERQELTPRYSTAVVNSGAVLRLNNQTGELIICSASTATYGCITFCEGENCRAPSPNQPSE